MSARNALDPPTKELVRIAVSSANNCACCIHPHTTSAHARGMTSVWSMQEQSRPKSLNLLSGCVRSAQLFEGHAGKAFA